MSAYYSFTHHQPQQHHQSQHGNHHGRNSRRAPRMPGAQNSQQQYNARRTRVNSESVSLTSYRQEFEAGRSFDLEDDMQFCPQLLTEDDLASISGSESSQASSSPHSSPTQPPQVVASTFTLNSSTPAFLPAAYPKMHQPAATRGRNAIPIVNPSTGTLMASPPQSVSPGRMHQSMGRRW